MITRVTGVSFSNEDGTSRKSIIASMSANDKIVLERDPYNEYDNNAVKVCVEYGDVVKQIGFIESKLASKLSPKMRRGTNFKVRIDSCGIYMEKPYCVIELVGVSLDANGELMLT